MIPYLDLKAQYRSIKDEIDRAGLLGHRQDIPKRFGERTADLKSRFIDYQMPTPARRNSTADSRSWRATSASTIRR